MILIFGIFILLLLNYTFYKEKFNKNYLSKNNTTIVNGFFIILVFFSHFQNYVAITNPYDILLYKIINIIGQLMVTTFLFFSGYGIYESVKNKKGYVSRFFKHRFLPTYTNWFLAILAFLVVNIILQNSLTISQVILSFIGWESLGNSNWYLFDIFVLYILFMISFNLFKNPNLRICCIIALTLVFIFVLSLFKEWFWYNTLLCFPLGMIYSYYKEKIDMEVMNNKSYFITLSCLLTLFIIIFFAYHVIHIEMLFNIASCLFVLLISFLLMKFELKSKILYWCGKNLFWIYILQRIPMMLFRDTFSNYNVYFIICFIITIFMVYTINYFKKFLNN